MKDKGGVNQQGWATVPPVARPGARRAWFIQGIGNISPGRAEARQRWVTAGGGRGEGDDVN